MIRKAYIALIISGALTVIPAIHAVTSGQAA